MIDWLLAHNAKHIYLLLFLLLLGGAIGLPIPEDIPLLGAGVAIHRVKISLCLTLAICYFGIMLGDLLIFAIGRKLGPKLFKKKWFRARVSPSRLRKLRANLSRRAFLMIILARHLFYMRTATFLICGAVKMPLWRFLIADAVAALISTPVMIGLGYAFSEHLPDVIAWVNKFKTASVLIFGAFLLSFALYKLHELIYSEEVEAACDTQGK